MNILRNVEMLKNLIQMICTWGKLLVINILPPPSCAYICVAQTRYRLRTTNMLFIQGDYTL